MTEEQIRSLLVSWCLGSDNIHKFLASHGLAIVPKEPTWEMTAAARTVNWPHPNIYGEFGSDSNVDSAAEDIYRAMIRAAQESK